MVGLFVFSNKDEKLWDTSHNTSTNLTALGRKRTSRGEGGGGGAPRKELMNPVLS